jgi:hypothetical protein
VASVEDATEDLGCTGQEINVQEMRIIETKRIVQEGEVGEILLHRNRRGSAALLAGLQREIRAAWGHDMQRNEGEMERRHGAFYRRGESSKRQG